MLEKTTSIDVKGNEFVRRAIASLLVKGLIQPEDSKRAEIILRTSFHEIFATIDLKSLPENLATIFRILTVRTVNDLHTLAYNDLKCLRGVGDKKRLEYWHLIKDRFGVELPQHGCDVVYERRFLRSVHTIPALAKIDFAHNQSGAFQVVTIADLIATLDDSVRLHSMVEHAWEKKYSTNGPEFLASMKESGIARTIVALKKGIADLGVLPSQSQDRR